jgi:hypothetical protein
MYLISRLLRAAHQTVAQGASTAHSQDQVPVAELVALL